MAFESFFVICSSIKGFSVKATNEAEILDIFVLFDFVLSQSTKGIDNNTYRTEKGTNCHSLATQV